MKARKLIKELERAIEESGEYDLDVVIKTKSDLAGKIRVYQTPLMQGETEIFAVIDTVER